MQRTGVLVFTSLFVLVSEPSFALVTQCTGAGQLCPSSGLCNITSTKDVAPGATIDCSGRDIVVKKIVRVTGGAFTLLANDLTVNPNKKIEAVASTSVEVGIDLQLTGAFSLSGRIVAENKGPGSFVRVAAEGPVRIQQGNGIDVSGVGNSSDGGEIEITTGQDLILLAPLRANGTLGGTSSNVNVGGSVAVEAATGLQILDKIEASGRWFGGGEVELVSDASIILGSGGEIEVQGRALDGDGGDVELTADQITVVGGIDVAGGQGNGGGEASGGRVLLDAGCGGLTVSGTVVATGGEFGGGSIALNSLGPIDVDGDLDTSALKNSGVGGEIEVESSESVVVSDAANLLALGDGGVGGSGTGPGGDIAIRACTVDIAANAGSAPSLLADGDIGGFIELGAADSAILPAGAGDFTLHVSEDAAVYATGSTLGNDGAVTLEVIDAVDRAGSCSLSSSTSCRLDVPDCVDGVFVGECEDANPELDGREYQFDPLPVVVQYTVGPTCSSVCP